jgi:hypothetical protein
MADELLTERRRQAAVRRAAVSHPMATAIQKMAADARVAGITEFSLLVPPETFDALAEELGHDGKGYLEIVIVTCNGRTRVVQR